METCCCILVRVSLSFALDINYIQCCVASSKLPTVQIVDRRKLVIISVYYHLIQFSLMVLISLTKFIR